MSETVTIPRAKLRDAVNKLNEILRILKEENHCATCRFWSGKCQKGKPNMVAADFACSLFEPRRS